MKADDLKKWIDSLVQDIDFEFQDRQGCICPFARNDILLIFEADAIRVHSVEDAMNETFIDGHSLAELCSSPDFVV